jgi:hypothetical protein
MLFRRSGSELFDTFTNIIPLRIFPLQNIYLSRPGIRRLRNTSAVTSSGIPLLSPNIFWGCNGVSLRSQHNVNVIAFSHFNFRGVTLTTKAKTRQICAVRRKHSDSIGTHVHRNRRADCGAYCFDRPVTGPACSIFTSTIFSCLLCTKYA